LSCYAHVCLYEFGTSIANSSFFMVSQSWTTAACTMRRRSFIRGEVLLSRNSAEILAEGGCVELDTNPVIHDHSLTWSTLHGPGRFEKVRLKGRRVVPAGSMGIGILRTPSR
jgi:hypothetical protein